MNNFVPREIRTDLRKESLVFCEPNRYFLGLFVCGRIISLEKFVKVPLDGFFLGRFKFLLDLFRSRDLFCLDFIN
jgi:hypothetical protein